MERKLYVSWYKLYFNDIFVDERTFSNHYYYDVPNEEPRVCKTFKNFKDFYSDFVKVVIPTKEDFIALVTVLEKQGFNSCIFKSEGTWYALNNVLDGSEFFRLYSEQETKDIVEQLEYFLKMK